jgi:hypothetical protein
MIGWDAAAGIAVSLVIRARDIFLALLGLGFGARSYRSFLFPERISEERS